MQISTTLFTIPARALINVSTLAPLYPPGPDGHDLTPVQMISLHLFLHKPGEDGVSADPMFGPFISTMPRDFASHPCTWDIKRSLGVRYNAAMETRLLQVCPPAVQESVQRLSSRFWDDWKGVSEYIVRLWPVCSWYLGYSSQAQLVETQFTGSTSRCVPVPQLSSGR